MDSATSKHSGTKQFHGFRHFFFDPLRQHNFFATFLRKKVHCFFYHGIIAQTLSVNSDKNPRNVLKVNFSTIKLLFSNVFGIILSKICIGKFYFDLPVNEYLRFKLFTITLLHSGFYDFNPLYMINDALIDE